ncbi:MAG: chromate transporter [Defluviitaleaceae bacterium]|nr:chromate transporter [Defluviitaleaceae bacterium]
MVLITLFLEFAKAGLFAAGGGLAIIPFLIEMSERHGWFAEAEIMNMIALAESAPGPLGANMATFVGYGVAGFPGAVVAVIALIFPALILVTIIAKFITQFSNSPYVKDAFYGLRPVVCAMITAACWGLIRSTIFTLDLFSETRNLLDLVHIPSLILFGVLLFLYIKFKKHPVFYLAGAAIVGIVFKF